MESRKHWNNIFKVWKGKKNNNQYYISGKLFFKNGEIKTFPEKQKLRVFVPGRLAYRKY